MIAIPQTGYVTVGVSRFTLVAFLEEVRAMAALKERLRFAEHALEVVAENPELAKEALDRLRERCELDPRYRVRVTYPQGSPVEVVRNNAARDFLESGADYLLMVDSDNPPLRNPLDLIEHDLDVVTCPTPTWQNSGAKIRERYSPLSWNVYDDATQDPERPRYDMRPIAFSSAEELEEVDAVGTGCILIARRVLEAVPVFVRRFDESGRLVLGSDLNWCREVRAAGFKIWAAWRYPCRHHNMVDLAEVADLLHYRRENINTPEYWNREWERRAERILPVYDEIIEHLKGSSARRVLDFGCGRGDLLAKLRDAGFEAVGVDHSDVGVRVCRERGLEAHVGSTVEGQWDAIVCTQVLEHLDDDRGMLEHFFEHANIVIYSVPNNCLPPSQEPEHQRLYTRGYVRSISPHLHSIHEVAHLLLVVCKRDVADPTTEVFWDLFLQHQTQNEPPPCP